MTTFCAEQGISRKTFYALRARARAEGQAAVLEPRSRRPRTSPTRLSEATADQAVAVRASPEGLSGPGPRAGQRGATRWSPWAWGGAFGGVPGPDLPGQGRGSAPSPARRPRAAWRRFVYPAPNACWQLDSTEYVLERGRKCVIFQLQDDHSRLAVASLVARAETSDAAVRVFDKGVRAYGVPQRPPDRQRGLVEPHPQGPAGPAGGSRQSAGRGAHHRQALQAHHPRRRNERFHSTLLRWLDKQPLAATVAEPPGTG